MHSILNFGDRENIFICAVIWAICVAQVVRMCRSSSGASVGLPIAYTAVFSILHFGALVYLLPWYSPSGNPYLRSQGADIGAVSVGFETSTIGMVAFLLGLKLSDYIYRFKPSTDREAETSPIHFGRSLVICGAVFFFIIFPVANRIPSGAAIASAGVQLSIIGICLFGYGALRSNIKNKTSLVAGILAFPIATVLTMGFIGYGINAVISITSFLSRFSRPNWRAIPISILGFWLLLSVYVSYMGARNDLRNRVWGNAAMSERMSLLAEKVMSSTFFDPGNMEHLYAIDTRLNQNILVGQCVEYIGNTGIGFANGESLVIAVTAWIPRIIWPGKPAFGGSSSFVSKYTGKTFGRGTSVGVGLIMEMYANFGRFGVIAGTLIMGIFIRYCDRNAAVNLGANQLWNYVTFHLVGIAAIQPGGLLAETVASCAAAAALAYGLKRFFGRNKTNTTAFQLAN